MIIMEIYNDTYCVYVHINKINGKMYVGQTHKSPENRWCNGKGYKSSPHFYSAIQKYGWDNFEHEIVASNLTKDEADNFERLLIDRLNLMQREYGYNLKEGGAGGKFSEATIRKMSESHSGEKHHMYGKHLPVTTKKKISESHMKRRQNVEFENNLDQHTEENNKSNVTKMQFDNSKKVYQYDLQNNFLKEWANMTRVAEAYNVGRTTVMRYCRSGDIFLNKFILKLEKT